MNIETKVGTFSDETVSTLMIHDDVTKTMFLNRMHHLFKVSSFNVSSYCRIHVLSQTWLLVANAPLCHINPGLAWVYHVNLSWRR